MLFCHIKNKNKTLYFLIVIRNNYDERTSSDVGAETSEREYQYIIKQKDYFDGMKSCSNKFIFMIFFNSYQILYVFQLV